MLNIGLRVAGSGKHRGGGGGGVPAFLTSGKAVGPGAGTAAFDTTGATLLVAALVVYNNDPVTPTDSESNTWVRIPGVYGGGGVGSPAHITIWYCYNPTTSVTHQFFNPTVGASFAGGVFLAFSGTLQTSGVIGNYNGTNSPGLPVSTGSVTPSLNDLIVACCGADADLASATVDSSFTTNASLAQ